MWKEAGESNLFEDEVRSNRVTALTISILLHTIVFLLFPYFTSDPIPTKKPLVIDLTWVERVPAGSGTVPKEQKKTGKNQIRASQIMPVDIENSDHKSVVNDSYTTPNTSLSKKEPLPEAAGMELTRKKAPIDVLHDGSTGAESGKPIQLGGSSTKGNIPGHTSGKGVPGDGTGDAKERLKGKYLEENFSYIKDIIQRNITYPRKARRKGWVGAVTVSFIILESGRVENIKILKSSGHELLDGNVMETIKAIGSFPKPPVKAELHIPIIYRLEL